MFYCYYCLKEVFEYKVEKLVTLIVENLITYLTVATKFIWKENYKEKQILEKI